MQERTDDIRPGSASVGGFEDSGAVVAIDCEIFFAGSDVDDVGIVRIQRDRAIGHGGLGIRKRLPGSAAVGGLPDPALRRANVQSVAVLWIDSDRIHPS